jgi:hypothetical protein
MCQRTRQFGEFMKLSTKVSFAYKGRFHRPQITIVD